MTSTLQQEASRKLRFSAAAHDARRPAPLRERLHHLHAHRLDVAVGDGARRGARPGARALRRRLRAGRAAPVQPQGQERAGGARGDPPGRRPLPHARRREARARAATRRRSTTWSGSAPSPRRWRTRAARPSRCASARTASDGRDAEFAHRRHRDHVPRLHARLRGGPRRGGRPTTRSALLPPLAEGDALERDRARARVALDDARPPATPRRRSCKALEERGIGRPSTYASIMGTILDRGYVRKQGQALVPDVPRVRGDEPARAAFRRGSSTTSSPR